MIIGSCFLTVLKAFAAYSPSSQQFIDHATTDIG